MISASKLTGAAIAVTAALASTQGSAAAQPKSRVLYAHRAWEVRGVTFDSNASMCVAQVRLDDAAFSIWADGMSPIKLQFYSPQWAFAESAADVEVQIDTREQWTLGSADFYKNAVFFNLPSDDVSLQFLSEIAGGVTLFLRDQSGEPLVSYTLSGSNASIRALGRCVQALQARAGDSDPFD